ncbi:MAG TPA: hypothetical protein VHK69_07490 [Chitinophagaceae bacterium]|jgi:hypothetical protein|nr:hypothetical protein [Chitinophagaceae bacterium]
MKRLVLFSCLLLAIRLAGAQELYVFSEPASNMPSHSISAKLGVYNGLRPFNFLGVKKVVQRYTPEIMFGFSKKFMVHAGTTFSNFNEPKLQWESAFLYAKYRFLSKDEVHRHFRMALFADGSYSRNRSHYDDIMLNGDMSGVQGGLIATQLLHKLAVSATGSFTKTFYARNSFHQHQDRYDKAWNGTLSAGYLILPLEYRDYNQLNLNVYTELLGQKTIGSEYYFLDIAPAVQLIFGSNSKLNIGYRLPLRENGLRNVRKGVLVSFEHTFFNALKK